MNVSSTKEVMVTITLSEREAKLLACLLGASSPTDAEEIVRRGIHFHEWIGTLKKTEVTDFTGTLYEALNGLF